MLWFIVIFFVGLLIIFLLFFNKKEKYDVIGDYVQTNNDNLIHLSIQQDGKRIKGEIHIYRSKPFAESFKVIEESNTWKLIGAPIHDTSYDLILTDEKGKKFNGILKTKNEISLQIDGTDWQRGEVLFTKVEKTKLNELIKDTQKDAEHERKTQEEKQKTAEDIQEQHEKTKDFKSENFISISGYNFIHLNIGKENEKIIGEIQTYRTNINGNRNTLIEQYDKWKIEGKEINKEQYDVKFVNEKNEIFNGTIAFEENIKLQMKNNNFGTDTLEFKEITEKELQKIIESDKKMKEETEKNKQNEQDLTKEKENMESEFSKIISKTTDKTKTFEQISQKIDKSITNISDKREEIRQLIREFEKQSKEIQKEIKKHKNFEDIIKSKEYQDLQISSQKIHTKHHTFYNHLELLKEQNKLLQHIFEEIKASNPQNFEEYKIYEIKISEYRFVESYNESYIRIFEEQLTENEKLLFHQLEKMNPSKP